VKAGRVVRGLGESSRAGCLQQQGLERLVVGALSAAQSLDWRIQCSQRDYFCGNRLNG
jgi:hypothetical protein